MNKPYTARTHQELLDFAIRSQCGVISEFGARQDYWRLRRWAIDYAGLYGLAKPPDIETESAWSIINYPPDREELAELGELAADWTGEVLS